MNMFGESPVSSKRTKYPVLPSIRILAQLADVEMLCVFSRR